MVTHESQMPVALLKELLSYDAKTGALCWAPNPNKPRSRCTGLIAGKTRKPTGQSRSSYREIGIRLPGDPSRRLWLLAHRVAWAIHHGYWPTEFIDHIDGNGLNNSIDNLRIATRSTNARNQPLHRDNKSGVTGVTWHVRARRWQAQAHTSTAKKRRCIYLGLHKTLLDAAAARKSFELANGFHQNHGRSASVQEACA